MFDTLGTGVMCIPFLGWKCSQWDTIQARLGSLGRSSTHSFPFLLPAPCQLCHTCTGQVSGIEN